MVTYHPWDPLKFIIREGGGGGGGGFYTICSKYQKPQAGLKIVTLKFHPYFSGFSELNLLFHDILQRDMKMGKEKHVNDVVKFLKTFAISRLISGNLFKSINSFANISQDLINGKSSLDQVMAWCLKAPSHYLNQGWSLCPQASELIAIENLCKFS